MDRPAIDQLVRDALVEMQAGRLDAASKLLQQASSQDPAHPDIQGNLGLLAMLSGQFAAGEAHLRAALKANPSHLPAATNLAILLRRTHRLPEALNLQRQLAAIAPEHPDHHYNLANTLLEMSDFNAAIESYQRALKLQPNHAKALTNLARAYQRTFQYDQWQKTLEKAVALANDPLPLSNYIFCSMFSPTATASVVAKLAEQWNDRFGEPLFRQGTSDSFLNTKDPDRILRIGYVAPTFRAHTIGYLIEPILARHDRRHFVVHCYSDVIRPDEVTKRIAESVKAFRPTAQLSDDQLTQQIQADGIDILIDLNAHMAGSRLGVFARRAAPVQIAYLAYPFTTGLRAMDYRFTDSILEPPGSPRFGPERLIRLQHSFWLYRPDPAVTGPAAPPSQSNGRITFGNLNDVRKLNDPLLKAWAKIMQAVPNSRLMQLTSDPATQGPYLLAMFARAGLDRQRIDLVGFAPHHEHLNRYRAIDLCLDPFPYGGHTTTLDATWMGVPTLTLAGDAPYMRGAASILNRVGLDSLVTKSINEYIRTAIELTTDPAKLASARPNLQDRMQSSILCDEPGFVAEFERGLRMAWARYCADQPLADLSI